MKKYFPYLVLALLAFFVMSCSEDKCEAIDCLNGGTCDSGLCDCPEGFEGEFCEEKIVLLENIFLDGELNESFSYLPNGDLSESISYSGPDSLVRTYQYYEDSLTISHNGIRFLKFVKESGNDIRRYFYPDGEIYGSYLLFRNVDQECGYSDLELYTLNEDVLFQRISLEYIDNNCSYTKQWRDIPLDSITATWEVTHDASNNYFPNGRNKFLPGPDNRNIVQRIVKDGGIEINELNSYNATFIYNSENYPVSEERIYLNGDVRSYIYQYY